ncbi:protein-glutamine gamma-glutamyltransferase 2 [Synchiropus splendidus]|uniref:protein-glutamine gamma-glutamyltransferase 2 n=1 Tax=Synchiropus splendidus TaxID=270530 RepID=UPI00237E2F5A|nr:protein-glutamine gamma-glutamyltransferase 2 [Synchiropus splendidus]
MAPGVILDVDPRSLENNSSHRTKEIDSGRLIVRRGQPFSIVVHCSHDPLQNHTLNLVLSLGTKDELVISVEEDMWAEDKWWFHQQEMQDGILVTLHSPADAIIGKYGLDVLLTSRGRVVEKTKRLNFHLLFNPWCKGDVVYLPDETLLQEYIMNENGVIFMGTSDFIRSIHWNYGQFEDFVMDICFEVLDNSNDALKNLERDLKKRCDPVYISRTITAMINSAGDKGVLTGRWDNKYSDGVSPSRWTGSVPILEQWSKSRCRAVRYGQCWVFAAVACTVLRCLGIPTRLITNFDSAHDTDGNLSVDYVQNYGSGRMETKGDSTWNFHCWVESWMKRQDLPEGNDGWQVLDPTPQELSDGVYCCGPCPVAAIKEGNLSMKYDAPFVFAEVNADVTYWVVGPDGRRRKANVDTMTIGRNISTKSVYSDKREDLTLHYKYPEGSEAERSVFRKAGRGVTEPSQPATEKALQLSIKHGSPVLGTDFDLIIEVKNQGGKSRTAELTIQVQGVSYNHVHRGNIQEHTTSVTVPAYEVHKEALRLRYEDYARCLSEHRLIRVRALLEPHGENEPTMTVTNIPLSVPELLVQVPGKAVVNRPMMAYISFTNPLPVPLRVGVFTLEGAGLLTQTQMRVKGEVGPGQKVAAKLSLTPFRAGVRKLVVDFDSDRLMDVKGVATVFVR